MNSIINHILISMPHMQDTYFNRSVIYMCELNKKGAMGLIINKPFKDPTLNKIFENYYDEKGEIFNAVDQIYFGGPVMVERGIVLHSGNYKSNDSIKISNDFFISSHKKTLEDISAQRGPELCRLLLGHAGWKAGQLEREIENGDWLLMPADIEFIFSLSDIDKWQAAVTKFGINISDLGGAAGLA